MFEATRMMYFYVETPLHAGTGRAMGAVDLPIQRERVTGYPMVQSSSIKGCLRAATKANGMDDAVAGIVFGPLEESEEQHAGALAPGDAKLLLFPVRSLAGVFAWTTSVEALARYVRDLTMLPDATKPDWKLPDCVAENNVLVNGNTLLAAGKIVLEEYALDPDASQFELVKSVGVWLANNALPSSDEYAYWRKAMPERLAILDNNAFRDFTQFATEVQTRIKLDPDKKTVQKGALWTEESLPVDTLLYSPLCATPSRNNVKLNGVEVIQKIIDLKLTRLQLGGDETTGRGIVSVRL